MIKIDWTARGPHLGAGMQARIEEQLQKLRRFLPGESQAHVIVTSEGDVHHPRHRVEIVVSSRLGTFTSTQEAAEVAEAARAALSRLDAQAHKAHDKMLAARRKGAARDIVEESAEA